MRCLGRSPSLSAQESGSLGRRIQHTYGRQTHRLQRRIRIFVMSAAMAPAQSYLVTRDTAAAARCASADPTGSATAIAGGAVTSGLLDDGGGVAQRVNAGSGALLSSGRRPGAQTSQAPAPLHSMSMQTFSCDFLFAPRERTYSNLLDGSMAKKQKSARLVHMYKPTVNKLA